MLTLEETFVSDSLRIWNILQPVFFAVYAQMRESEIKTSRSGRLCEDAACGIHLCRNESSDVRKRL